MLTTTNIWELNLKQSSQMAKTFRDNCDKNIVQQTSCEPLFPNVQMELKMNFFVAFVRPCMHHKYGGISESHACKDCVWPISLDAELFSTFPGERVLVVMTHQVQECTFHDGCKQGIDQQIFNRKSISRKITHPQS